MSAHMCTSLQTKVNSGCLPSQCTLYLRFQSRIFHGNRCLLILLVGQQVPRILLSPPSCNWDYKHSLLDRDFYMDAKNKLWSSWFCSLSTEPSPSFLGILCSGETAWQLRADTALADDMSLVPNPTSDETSYRGSSTFFETHLYSDINRPTHVYTYF